MQLVPELGEYVAFHDTGEELTVVSRESHDACGTGNVRCCFWDGSGLQPDAPNGAGVGSLCSQHVCSGGGKSFNY